MNNSLPVHLIAVVGGSGSGKSWLVKRLCRLLGEKAAHLQLDNFYRDRSHLPLARRARLNFDVPHAIDWAWAERVLQDFRSGTPTRVPRYDFATHSRAPDTACEVAVPRPVVFVDGLWLLRPPALRELFDLKIFLDAPTNVRCTRRLSRDAVERGYTPAAIKRQLRETVVPMHHRYVEPQKKWADIVLRHPFTEPDLLALADLLWDLLNRAALVQPWEHATFRAELLDLLSTHEYCA